MSRLETDGLTRVLSRVQRQRSVRYDRCRCRGVLAFSSTRALSTHRPVTAGRRSSSRVRLFRETRTKHTLRLSFPPNLPSLFPSFADAVQIERKKTRHRPPTAPNFSTIAGRFSKKASTRDKLHGGDEKRKIARARTRRRRAWRSTTNVFRISPALVFTRRRYEGETHGTTHIRNARCDNRGTTGCGGATLRREDRGFVASATLGNARRSSRRRAARLLHSTPPPARRMVRACRT